MDHYAELYHYGIRGMHWGVRRFQNYDNSLTPEGREHYGVGPARIKADQDLFKAHKKYEKVQNEYDAQEHRTQSAFNNINKAKAQYANQRVKYDKIKNKLDKTQSGLGAKIVGIDHAKERRLTAKLENEQLKLDRIDDIIKDAESKYWAELNKETKLHNKVDKEYEKLERKIDKYIDKYGNESYSSLEELFDYDYERIPDNYYTEMIYW